MAAAWVLAMGPVGWVIAAVVALVALIIANWDTVVSVTKAIFGAIWDFLQWIWSGIVSVVSGAVDGVLAAIEWLGSLPGKVGAWFRGIYDGAVAKLGELLSWLGGLPGRLLSAIGDLGSLLLNVGKDLLTGLWNGIKNAASWLKDMIFDFFGSLIPDWVKDILGISSPSRVFADIGRWIPPGLAAGIDRTAPVALGAVGDLATAMSDEMADATLYGTMTSSLVGGDTGASNGGPYGGTTGGIAQIGGPGSSDRGDTTVNVYASTNADPHEIGTEVAWAVRTTGR